VAQQVPRADPLLPEEVVDDVPKVPRRASPRTYVSTAWTSELKAELTRLWLDHFTCAHIAHKMGMTRNQIIGKAHRMGLPRRQNPVDAPPLDVVRKRAAKRKEYMREVVAVRPPRIRVEQPVGLPDPSPCDRILLIEDLTADACKFPCDGGGFCGRERWEESHAYCRSHHLRCHVKRREHEHA
jgi:GcrA cell cycle regulator